MLKYVIVFVFLIFLNREVDLPGIEPRTLPCEGNILPLKLQARKTSKFFRILTASRTDVLDSAQDFTILTCSGILFLTQQVFLLIFLVKAGLYYLLRIIL